MADMYDQEPGENYRVRESNGLAIASLVLGIVSVVLMCLWYMAIPCAILAVIFGVIGRQNAQAGAPNGGMATAGLILGIFGLALPLLIVGGCLAILGLGGDELLEAIDEAARELEVSAGTAPDVQTNGGL